MNQKAHILSLQLFVRIIFTEKQRTSPKTFWTSKVQLNFELKNGYLLFFLSPKHRTLNFGLKLYKFGFNCFNIQVTTYFLCWSNTVILPLEVWTLHHMYRHHLTMVNYTLNVGTGRIWLCSQLLHYIQITPYFIFWSNPVLLNWRSAVFLHPTVSVLWLQINKGKVPCNLLRHWSREVLGRDPWSCGYGRRLMFWRLWVRILVPFVA